MKLLALRLCAHDSNFALYDNGEVRYIKTERIYQEKHHKYNNLWEWKYDLPKMLDVELDEIDEIAIVVDNHSRGLPNPMRTSMLAQPFPHLNVDCPVTKIEHHYAHALSDWMIGETKWQFAFDGFGEEYSLPNADKPVSVGWTVFKNYIPVEQNLLEPTKIDHGTEYELNYFSLGVLHDRVADHIGIEGGQLDKSGKLMSLQKYGNFDEAYYQMIKDYPLEEVHEHYNPEHFIRHCGNGFVAENRMLDYARTVNESIPEKLIEYFYRCGVKKEDSILFTGGCAQNILWNTELKKEFPNLVVLPHSADEGLSLGALKWLMDKHNVKGEMETFPYAQEDQHPLSFPSQETLDEVAEMLADGKIVGWYQGNGEIGPRALGNRSILMRPDAPHGKDFINERVKHRETYRPFGASVLKERQDEYFDLPYDNPYMMYVANVKRNLPAITHIDETCRHQTVTKESNPSFYRLLKAFESKTGLALLLNTSLNRGGKPIAGSLKDAMGLLEETQLDAVVYGDKIITRKG